jgi:DNA-binding protein H-NS
MAKSLAQIQKQIEKLQVEAKGLRAKEVGGVIARIKEAISYYDLKPTDLFGVDGGRRSKAPAPSTASAPVAKKSSKVKGSRVPIKYRDNNGNTWTGRGSKPRWLVAELAAGKKLETFLIEG